MIVVPLAVHSPRAVREVLRAHGWDEVRADAAAGGVGPLAFHLTGLPESALLVLVRHAGQLGLEILTGEDWALLAGSRAKLGALARPWVVPPELGDLAEQLGRALPESPPPIWETARGSIAVDRPVIMGILNVTPDSFSDGGQFTTVDAAVAHADRLLDEGATLLDIGGESTRPGGPEPVAESEELRRVIPVIDAIGKRHPSVPLSVDTVKAGVARAALSAGAAVVNDVSAFRLDPEMASVVRGAGAGVVLMHSRGDVSTMATLNQADYNGDVVATVLAELRAALEAAVAVGVAPERIVLDPGFGFAKSAEHNMQLCDRLSALLALGRPILVGPSRKRFLGSITGREILERDAATAAACLIAYEEGARLFRVHNPAAVRDALAVAHAIRGGVR